MESIPLTTQPGAQSKNAAASQSEAESKSKQESLAKLCNACYQPIHPKAKICYHCGKSQANDRWHRLSSFLKWAGGITAVFSLVMTMVQVNDLMGSWRYKQISMDRLLYAANIQRDNGDYLTAWNSYSKILELDPTNGNVFQEQLILVKQWLHTPYVYYRDSQPRDKDKTLSQYLDSMITILYQGLAGQSNPHEAADIYAYLSWVNIMKTQYDQIQDLDREHYAQTAQKLIAKAMQLDDQNLLANAMNAYISYYTESSSFKDAWKRDFPSIDKIIHTSTQDVLVTSIRKLVLTDWTPNDFLFQYANEMREKNLDTAHEFRNFFIERRIVSVFMEASTTYEEQKQFLTALDRESALKTIHYIFSGYENKRIVKYHLDVIAIAFINEFTGDKTAALKQLRELLDTENFDEKSYQDSKILKVIHAAIARLSTN